MKIFAVYIKIELTNKPDWFDAFRDEYDDKYLLHITLIQPRYIKESNIEKIKEKIKIVLVNNKLTTEEIRIKTSDLISTNIDNKYLFMLPVFLEKKLFNIQSQLKDSLSEYNNYCNNLTKKYEEEFKPHITITKLLNPDLKKEAEKYFIDGPKFEGYMDSIILPIVNDFSIEEAINPKNLNVFELPNSN